MTFARDTAAFPSATSTDFTGLLARGAEPRAAAAIDDDTAHDLALDHVLAALRGSVTDQRALDDVFRHPLRDEHEVHYRQDVFIGLEQDSIRSIVVAFLEVLADVRRSERDAAKSRYPLQQARLHLSAVLAYCDAVAALAQRLLPALDAADVSSAGLRGLADHVERVRRSDEFRELRRRAHELDDAWATINFDVLMKNGTLFVAPFDNEPALADEVEQVFERFRRAGSADHHSRLPDDQILDHVQAWVLEAAGDLHPDVVGPLLDWVRSTADFTDDVLDRCAKETEFFFAFLDLIAPLRERGLPFSYPEVSTEDKRFDAATTFDLALAISLTENGAQVVTNDLALQDGETVLVITGPNQGGKTTTARLFGQLHHLAALGCPVPGSAARVFLPDRVMTCFGREERLESLEGRMGEEVQRIKTVLDEASEDSVVVLNEIFASTALQDAKVVNREVLTRLIALGALCVCVTFIDEISRLDPCIVSLVSTVDPDDPTVRTFKLERRPADGRAYAVALAQKHALTYPQLRDRLSEQETQR